MKTDLVEARVFVRCGIRRATREVLIQVEYAGRPALRLAASISGALSCIETTRRALRENPSASCIHCELVKDHTLKLDRKGAETLTNNLSRACLDLLVGPAEGATDGTQKLR